MSEAKEKEVVIDKKKVPEEKVPEEKVPEEEEYGLVLGRLGKEPYYARSLSDGRGGIPPKKTVLIFFPKKKPWLRDEELATDEEK